MASLVRQSYGKHSVRVSKIKRHPGNSSSAPHDFFEASVNVELDGDFAATYLHGDNQPVIATDTCRNTVYVLAKDDPIDSLESFGIALANHFLDKYAHIQSATISLEQKLWHRMLDCPHGFVGTDSEVPTAKIAALRLDAGRQIAVTSGIGKLIIAKTTQSGFANFHRDEFRTLPDTDDRVLATSLTASWVYASQPTGDFNAVRQVIRRQLMTTFLDHYSNSVQETLYRMATAVIEICPSVDQITLTMPNIHHIRFNLEPFGRSNDNEVFVSTTEPYGYITATVGRS